MTRRFTVVRTFAMAAALMAGLAGAAHASDYCIDVTGSACTTADGSHMYVVLTESARGSGTSHTYHLTVDLLSPGKGDGQRQDIGGGYIFPLTLPSAQPCASSQPVL